MESTDRWDLALLAMAVYIAVVMLVRRIARGRDQLVNDLCEQVQRQQLRNRNQIRQDRAQDKSDAA